MSLSTLIKPPLDTFSTTTWLDIFFFFLNFLAYSARAETLMGFLLVLPKLLKKLSKQFKSKLTSLPERGKKDRICKQTFFFFFFWRFYFMTQEVQLLQYNICLKDATNQNNLSYTRKRKKKKIAEATEYCNKYMYKISCQKLFQKKKQTNKITGMQREWRQKEITCKFISSPAYRMKTVYFCLLQSTLQNMNFCFANVCV